MNDSTKMTQSILSIVLCLYVVFIGYASLSYGVEGVENPVRTRLEANASGPTLIIDSKDIILNFIFYLPFGLFVAALASQKKKLSYVSPLCFVGLVLSVVLEGAQSAIGRYSSLLDVIVNTFGFAVGFGLFVFTQRRYGFVPLRMFEKKSASDCEGNLRALRFIYVFVFLIFAIYPLDVSFRPESIWAEMAPLDGRTPRIVLNPFSHFMNGNWFTPDWILVFLGYFPLGLLTGMIEKTDNKPSLFRTLAHCAALSLVTEVLHIFVLSRGSDVFAVVVSIVAGASSWLLLRFLRARRGNQAEAGAQTDREKKRWGGYATLYGAVLCVIGWAPFDFDWNFADIVRKIRYESNWIPFQNHLTYHSIGNAIDLIKETTLFIPLGILLFLFGERRMRAKSTIIFVGGLCFVFSGFLEFTQGACVERYPDITDVILATLGGLVGVLVVVIYRRGRPD